MIAYSPSAEAVRFTVNDYNLSFDTTEYSDGSGAYVNLVLMQLAPGGWNYVGNQAPASLNDGNAGLIWQLNVQQQTVVYNPPGQPGWSGGNAVACMNFYKNNMILDWLAFVSALIRRIFGLAPPVPPSGQWPVTTWEQGADNLSIVLKGIVWDGNNLVVK